MAFDGGFLHCIINELSVAENSHVDKIYQPSRDELILLLRKKGFAKRLLLSAKSGAARIQFTEEKYENPEKPPMLCMLARKHFSAARLTKITQHGLDRIAELHFDATNEMGDRVALKIICELIGNKSNIILLGADGRIIDAVRRSDIETCDRIIHAGAVYTYPGNSERISLLGASAEAAAEAVLKHSQLPLGRAVMSSLEGISPLIGREIAFLAQNPDGIAELTDKKALTLALETVSANLHKGKPTMLADTSSLPKDFSYMPVCQYGNLYTVRQYESFSLLLDGFYSERESAERIRRAAADIIKLTDNLIARTVKRLAARRAELEACADREQLRVYGELIKANIHLIKAGATSATVDNFYDENMAPVTIPLDPALNAAANAAKYFKGYKKSTTASRLLAELIEKDIQEKQYLESVAESITRCKTAADIAEIREELRQEGYIKAPAKTKRKSNTASPFFEYVSEEGYRIAVGKNNTQNDILTLKTASKKDMWFHVKNAAGSHVIVFSGGGPISDNTLLLAARLAAENSKLAATSNAAVDYTPVKYVKKPVGAKAGMVIYSTNKTLFVTPRGREE